MIEELSRERLFQVLDVVLGWEQIADEDGVVTMIADLATLIGFARCALFERRSRRTFSAGGHDGVCIGRLEDIDTELASLLVRACDEAAPNFSTEDSTWMSVQLRSARTKVVIGSLCMTTDRPYADDELAILVTITPFMTAVFERLASAREVATTTLRKDVFLAALGHDLRSPLAAISSTIAAMRIRQSSSELELIDRQLGYMTRLADDLVDVSGIARGKIALDLLPVDLPLMVDRGIERAASELASRGHAVVVDIPATSVFVLADLDRMSNVVRKIVCSISRRLERGGRIKIEVTRVHERAILRVSRLAGPRARGLAEGSGAWLPLDRSTHPDALDTEPRVARQIVELHGGTLETEPGPQEIKVELPRTRISTDEHELPANVAAREHEVMPCRVLVVDDDVDLADAVGIMLRELGHVTALAHDGETALALLAEFQPNVALVNIGLPGMDGYQVADALRKIAPAGVRLVAMTGLAARADIVKTFAAGFDEHLVKPVDLATMTKAIHPSALAPIRQV